VPVVIDGFIAAAAALAAQAIEPAVTDWMLASHVSRENGHALALNALGLSPLIDFEMRLGEGSGAALIVPLLQSAIALHNEMATFASAEVTDKDE
ncbi:MAG: nicotinate-nucleotide--dimethylbenzimidazole phosphoribosyltransferase, partial [Mariprofundus sp.]